MDYNAILPNGVIKDLICSICKNYLSYFPIHITSNDQNICGRCTLPEDITPVRNKVYEISVQEVRFPCRYNNEGCVEKLPPKNIPKHEQRCLLRPVKCPASYLEACTEIVSFSDVVKHCTDKHSDLILESGEFQIELSNSAQNCNLVIEDNEVFIFKRSYLSKTNTFSYLVSSSENKPKSIPKKYMLCVKNIFANITRHGRVCKNPQDQNFTSFCVDVLKNIEDDLIGGKLRIGDYLQKSSSEEEFKDNLLKVLQCSYCSKYIKPPVFAFFGNNETLCPSCDNSRKRVSEHSSFHKIAEKLLYPCGYEKNGCNYKSLPRWLKQHELYCHYKDTICPFSVSKGCPWTGFGSSIKSHIIEDHHGLISTSSCYDINVTTLCIGYLKSRIIKFAKYFFYLHLFFDGCWFSWSLEKMVDCEDKFRYELEILSKRNDYEKVINSRICEMFRNHEEHHSNCLFEIDQLKHLFDDKHMRFQIRIFKL